MDPPDLRQVRQDGPGVVTVGNVVLDPSTYLVAIKGHQVALSPQECRLLEALMTRADHVLSVSCLLELVWGPDFTGGPSTVAVHVLRLRKKLSRAPKTARHIRTVRGAGYIFDTHPVTVSASKAMAGASRR